MSSWTYISGTINVSPLGRTQHEMRYVLETVLSHLPLVTGSEKNMYAHIIQRGGYNSYDSTDEFGQFSNLFPKGEWGGRDMKTQTEYILVVEGMLRDRTHNETLKEFNKWLCRLAKRCIVDNVLVEISTCDKSTILTDRNNVYFNMFEPYTEGNWCNYLMWKDVGAGVLTEKDGTVLKRYSFFPVELKNKYKNKEVWHIVGRGSV